MEKIVKLERMLSDIGKDGLCIAFSGGVDSALLLKKAALLLGDRVTAVTFSSRLCPHRELEEAGELAKLLQVHHYFLKFDEFTDEKIMDNPPERCYYCKKFIFRSLQSFCQTHGLGPIADGTNADDLNEYRPGLRALRELEIYSPLAACGLTKAEVREEAKALGLAVHSKPSAPCLATRIPYGTRLTEPLLRKVESCEEFLKELGFNRCRVRTHGEIARIEVPAEFFDLLLIQKAKITDYFKTAGFLYITLDLEGLRSGSMDLPLKRKPAENGR